MASMRSVGVRLRLWVDQYKREAAEAAKSTEAVGKSGTKAKKDLDELAGTLTVVGTALTAAFAGVVYVTARFDKQMSEVGAVAGATAEQFQALRQAAIDAGAATSFSASEAAQAEAELAKAGISTADILGGALSGALSLAAAGSLDLATAATIAAAAMNTFGLKGSDVGHIADVLAAAANKSSASVESLGIGLGQVGLVAAQVGLTLEETVAILAAMADRGLSGSDAATSLKTALLRLAAPLPEAAAAMERFGISLYDANGNMVDAEVIAGQLERGLGKLSSAERNAALATIFGSDAIRAANVLYELGKQGVRDYVEAVDDQGAAAEVAAKKLDNLAGDFEALTGSLETLLISSGGVSDGLRFLVETLTGVVNVIGLIPGPVLTAATAIVGLAGVTALATAAKIKLSGALLKVNASLVAMGPAGLKAAAGLRVVTAAAGPLGLALLAAGTAMAFFGDVGEDFDAALQKRLIQISPLAKKARELGVEFTDLAGATSGLDAKLAEMVANGQAGIAARHFEQFAAALQRLGPLADVIGAKFFPQYTAATREVAESTEDAGQATFVLGGAFGRAALEADGLKAAFDRLNGVTLDWRAAERQAEAAVDDLIDALKESNGSLDVTTKEGRAAAAAIDDLAKAAVEAAQAKYDETGSIEEANRVYADYEQQLRDILIANAGGARATAEQRAEIEKLIDSIMGMPEYKEVTIVTRMEQRGADGRPQPRNEGPAFNRWGGAYTPAAVGVLRQAHVASTANPARYAYAEPATQGEAFVPKVGNYGRSMSILSQAAGWYNADVIPRGGYMAGGGGALEIRVSMVGSPDGEIARAVQESLRFDVVNVGGGDVQTRYGQRGRLR